MTHPFQGDHGVCPRLLPRGGAPCARCGGVSSPPLPGPTPLCPSTASAAATAPRGPFAQRPAVPAPRPTAPFPPRWQLPPGSPAAAAMPAGRPAARPHPPPPTCQTAACMPWRWRSGCSCPTGRKRPPFARLLAQTLDNTSHHVSPSVRKPQKQHSSTRSHSAVDTHFIELFSISQRSTVCIGYCLI